LQGSGIPVSFYKPAVNDVEISKKLGSTMIEIHTGLYSNAKGKKQIEELKRVKKAVNRAHDIGLLVNAGMALTIVI